ncbi:beta-N-acetylglucosaminidase domain-containing protein [Mitsuokella jalaludinii]|uniref:beta-N-acetylglucosaminidase domain-containing protein n=1 Tax=Mitsuokella jalaludinii TaxID=187979 RepID=UPI00307A3943
MFFNPMKVEALSKIALATGADYAEDPEHYDPEKSWQEAIKRQYGPLAKDMALFAAGSRHLENDWASIGLADDPDFAATAERLLESWPDGAGAKEAHAALLAMADARAKAAGRLLKELPPEQLKACRPQLEQTVRLASASRTALMLLQVQQAVAKDGGRHERSLRDKLQRELTAIDQHEAEAEVSEKAMGAFVRNVARRR